MIWWRHPGWSITWHYIHWSHVCDCGTICSMCASFKKCFSLFPIKYKYDSILLMINLPLYIKSNKTNLSFKADLDNKGIIVNVTKLTCGNIHRCFQENMIDTKSGLFQLIYWCRQVSCEYLSTMTTMHDVMWHHTWNNNSFTYMFNVSTNSGWK